MIKEFKEFALKGNLVDMAIAFVMGGAFGKLVTTFIDGIFMPVVGLFTAGVDFKTLKWIIVHAEMDTMGNIIKPETSIAYGQFITVMIDFLLVAFIMFLLVKSINSMKRKQVEAPATPPAPSIEEKLLTEIRDLLKK